MITLTVTLTQTFNLLNKRSHYIWQGKFDVDVQAESMSLSQDKNQFHLKVFLLSVLGPLFTLALSSLPPFLPPGVSDSKISMYHACMSVCRCVWRPEE